MSAATNGAADPRSIGADLVGKALGKPRLLVQPADPDETVARLRDVLAGTGQFYDRGAPVRLAHDQQQGGIVAHPLTPEGVIREAHGVSRPYSVRERKDSVQQVNVALPKAAALMYLDWRGEWGLPALNGIASAPLLDEAGGIVSAKGYDPNTGMFCENVPDLSGLVPDQPTRAQAMAALLVLRRALRTFAFKDAMTVPADDPDAPPVVDLQRDPEADESAALHGLLTALCRPSLDLAPGLLIRAALQSGAGTGKGLLARTLCAIAYGRAPGAVTAGGTGEEFEKRIGAELMGGGPVLFLDNLNSHALRSETLASAITERPSRVRVLGKSVMVTLNATAFIVLTGNGLHATEDLARRFLTCELDAKREDPEARRFRGDLLADVRARRAVLLAAALTVWRWGRRAGKGEIAPGLPLGSFAQWCRWVRDPLLTLGCRDPAARVVEAKQRDQRRQQTAELFDAWHRAYGSTPKRAAELHGDVLQLLDPQGRGRQYVVAALTRLAGTRAADFVLTSQAPSGTWGATTYALHPTAEAEPHRGHRDHREADPASSDPMPPMPPMPDAAGHNASADDAAAPDPHEWSATL